MFWEDELLSGCDEPSPHSPFSKELHSKLKLRILETYDLCYFSFSRQGAAVDCMRLERQGIFVAFRCHFVLLNYDLF